MTWECLSCTTTYAPDSPRCPHCGGTEWRETGSVADEPEVEVEGDEEQADEASEETPAKPSRRRKAEQTAEAA